MAWRRPGDKPLSEPIMVRLPTHICITRPQWVHACCDFNRFCNPGYGRFWLAPFVDYSIAPYRQWINLHNVFVWKCLLCIVAKMLITFPIYNWSIFFIKHLMFKGYIMDRCVLLTSTPECAVSPTTHAGVDVNSTHVSMINPDYDMMPKISALIYQYIYLRYHRNTDTLIEFCFFYHQLEPRDCISLFFNCNALTVNHSGGFQNIRRWYEKEWIS